MDCALRQEMAFDDNLVHFNNAGVSPMTRAAGEAIERVAKQHGKNGFHAIPDLYKEYEATRASFAKLVGAESNCVSMFQTCASAITQVASGIDFKPGDEIIQWTNEYGSNVYPWFDAARRSGAQVTLVPTEEDLSVQTEKLIAAISARTRVVAISWIQYRTGAASDLAAISEVCRKHDTWLVVDAIQGLGVIPFDMQQLGVDVVCGGTHKWLLGPIGHGFAAFKSGRAEELHPILHGTITYGEAEHHVHPAREPRTGPLRFEPGTMHLFGAIGGAASIDVLLEIGIENVWQQAYHISELVRNGVLERGFDVVSPVGESQRSPIVTFRGKHDVAELGAALRQHKISHAERSIGIRISPHGFSSQTDVDRLFEALDGIS